LEAAKSYFTYKNSKVENEIKEETSEEKNYMTISKNEKLIISKF
jgi:hypothetical protein